MKIMVAHPDQQHSFRTASAVKKTGMLHKYVTTIYDKKNSLTRLVKRLLRGDNLIRANSRKTDELEEREIKQFCEITNLIQLLVRRFDHKKILYCKLRNHMLMRFNRKLWRYADKSGVKIVILYDTVSWGFIQNVRKHGSQILTVIDMSAPYLHYMDLIYQEYLECNGEKAALLSKYVNSENYKQNMIHSEYEKMNADYFLVASEFSKKSLEQFGVPSERIFTCRYGIDISGKEIEKKKQIDKLKCLYIGDVVPQKGFITLEKVMDELGFDNYEFHIVGSYSSEDELYCYNKDRCIFYGYVTRRDVLEICGGMDVIIFPSLADGFGLSVIEAMSKKLVPIISKNAGASDIIVDGKNGYTFDLDDIQKVVLCCRTLFENTTLLKLLREAAYVTVKSMNWSEYEASIKEAIIRIVKNENLLDV